MTPAGYPTGPVGELGRVRVRGTGDHTMILIPGLGFGGNVFDALIDGRVNTYTSGGGGALYQGKVKTPYRRRCAWGSLAGGLLVVGGCKRTPTSEASEPYLPGGVDFRRCWRIDRGGGVEQRGRELAGGGWDCHPLSCDGS